MGFPQQEGSRGVVGAGRRPDSSCFLPAPCYSFSRMETFGPQRVRGSGRGEQRQS